jgi:glycosyltransferase involved in cell wall biosynthesis
MQPEPQSDRMSTRKSGRLFYFAPVSTDSMNRKYGQYFDVGAASNKVVGVCIAVQRAGCFPVVVSGLLPGMAATEHLHTDGLCFAKLPVFGHGAIKRLAAGLAYLRYAMRFTRKGDVVLLYNYFPEFVPVALYLRLMGRPAVLDIEDGPRDDVMGLFDRAQRLSFRLLMRLCARKYVIVSRSLALRLGLERFLPVYGVASFHDGGRVPKFAGPAINILFSGSIDASTGLGLFSDAVRLLAGERQARPLHFFVSGKFEEAPLRALAADVEARSDIRITLTRNLSRAEYRQLAENADVGLSLKLPSHAVGQTTFPSKVLEFAAMGMLLCATPVSDVPEIFNKTNAVLLESEEPRHLADVLRAIAANPAGALEKAQRGRAEVLTRFSDLVVGNSLIDFLGLTAKNVSARCNTA